MTELKPGWRRVKFAELAECVNDRVDDPANAGVDRYVGLEHLDPDSLRIRRWGSPTDVESTKLRFKPGDIIFGKRRAYQRKLAVADFEGICSAHAMVLRAKHEFALPEFLPCFMQSDSFMKRAVEISVGSLSPTINWKTLAQQEFVLPPPEEQQRIGQALDAITASIEASSELKRSSQSLLASTIDSRSEEFSSYSCSVSDLVNRQILCPPQDGNHGGKHPKASDYVAHGIPFLMASDIRGGRVNLETCKFISPELAGSLRPAFRARQGDVLLTHKGTIGEVALLKDLATEYAMLTPQVTYYRVRTSDLLAEYLALALQGSSVQQQLASLGRQSTRAFVSRAC